MEGKLIILRRTLGFVFFVLLLGYYISGQRAITFQSESSRSVFAFVWIVATVCNKVGMFFDQRVVAFNFVSLVAFGLLLATGDRGMIFFPDDSVGLLLALLQSTVVDMGDILLQYPSRKNKT